MTHNRNKNIFYLFFLIYFFLNIFSYTVVASEIKKYKVLSKPGKRLVVKLKLDLGTENPVIEFGTESDYKNFNIPKPDFLEKLRIVFPKDFKKKGEGIFYIFSSNDIYISDFVLLLKTMSDYTDSSYEIIKISLPVVRTAGKPNLKKIYGFSLSGNYKIINREIRFTENLISSKIKLATVRIEKDIIMERLLFFFHMGLGIQEIKDSVIFAPIKTATKLSIHDTGRNTAFGGGVKGILFKRNNIHFFSMFDLTHFNNTVENTTFKMLRTSIKTRWTDYRFKFFLKYIPLKKFKPIVGMTYSLFKGSVLVSQTFGKTIGSEEKEFRQKSGLGILIGSDFLYADPIKISTEFKLLLGKGRFEDMVGFVFGMGINF